jgi:TPR repeat protein
MRNLLTKLFFNVLFGALLSPSAWADYKAADEAAKVRNWSAVVKECTADAEAGEKNCQSQMGYLYKMGFGVVRNLSLSVEFLKKCARTTVLRGNAWRQLQERPGCQD